jgi:hypothetical protein
MVDTSLLFRKAETSFFLNLHNALMLHTHYYRKTQSGTSMHAYMHSIGPLNRAHTLLSQASQSYVHACIVCIYACEVTWTWIVLVRCMQFCWR